jgi:flagellar FliL protein
MAKKESQEKRKGDGNSGGEEGSGDKKPGNSKKIILLAVIGLVVIGASVGGTIFALKMFSKPEVKVVETEHGPVEQLIAPAIYYALKPAIVANYSVKGKQRFLQVDITVLTREDDVLEAIQIHESMLRNSLVMLIGGQSFTEVQTAEGKELLRQQCLQELQRLLVQEIKKPGVEQVLFTSFVMQ